MLFRRALLAAALALVGTGAAAQGRDTLDPFRPALPCTTSACALKVGIVASYHFEEASGTRADQSPYARSLTAVNTPGNNTGKLSNAMTCVAASSQHADSSVNPPISFAADFAFTGWVYFDTSTGFTRTFVGNVWNVRFNGSTNRIGVTRGGADVLDATTFGAISNSTWYFVFADFRASDKRMRISINDGTKDSITGTSSSSTTAALKLGCNLAANNFHDGRVDEWNFWARLLTDTEITNLYNAGTGATVYP